MRNKRKIRKESGQASIGIGEASRMIGVSEVTLRNWTNQGRVKAFTTPGGHRRYELKTLVKFMADRLRVSDIDDLVAMIEVASREHRNIARSRMSRMPWYARLDEETISGFAKYGIRLQALVVSYLSFPQRRKKILEDAKLLGCRFGGDLARHRLPLEECVRSFLMQRAPVLNAVAAVLKKHGTVTRRVSVTLPLVMQVLDETLIALVAAHQRYTDEHPGPCAAAP